MGSDRRDHTPTIVGTAILLLFMVTMLSTIPIGYGHHNAAWPLPLGEDLPEGSIRSFSGVHKVSDFASTMIYGEDTPGRGRLGHFSWTGDVNGDGLNDLVVAAPGAPGVGGFEDEGRIYIFYGGNGSLPKMMDLDVLEPDIMIISNNTWFQKPPPALPYPVFAYLTNEFDVGDFDGDGFRDMVLTIPCTDTPVWGVIIYGSDQGFPDRLVVHLQKTSVFSETPGDMRFRWLTRFGLTPGQDNLIIPNHLVTHDLDGDGADEIISASSWYQDFTARYGAQILWGGTTGTTSLYGATVFDQFGWSIDIGDVDNEGSLDLLIGAPLADDPLTGKVDCGAAYLISNASSLKDVPSVTVTDIARPMIYGGSVIDSLGKNVLLRDIDNDGKDDIIVAAPDADDGPSVHECGRVYAYRGGANNSFPARMVSDDSAHWTLIGNRGKVSGANDYPGDRIGTVMDAGDVDGDGRDEFVLGTYSATSTLSEPVVVDNVGTVSVHEASDIFPTGGAIQRMGRTDGSLVIEGDGMRDTLGWHVTVGDVTNDGVDDILVGAPATDGPDDLRISDGEAYIIEGSNTRIGEMIASGPGYSEPYLLAGGLNVRTEVDIDLSGKDRNAQECWLSLRSSGLTSKLTVGDDGLISVEGPAGLTPIEGGCGLDQKNGVGQAFWSFSLDWSFMREGPIDATVVLKDEGGSYFYREYPSIFTLTKDVMLKGGLEVRDARGPLSGVGEWVFPGAELTFSGPKAVYSLAQDVELPDGALDLVLRDPAGTIEDDAYTSGWSFIGKAPGGPSWDLTLTLQFPGGAPRPFDMDMDGAMTFRVNIDTAAPLHPEGIRAISASNGLPVYDRSGRFYVIWNGTVGPDLDPGGSGVREFQVLEGGTWRPALGDGGLTGTYYRGRGFQEMAFQRTDGAINFTTMDWGPFGPDPYMVRFDDFSVRWHGYLVPEMNGSYLLSLKGSGSAMVKMDGMPLMQRTDVMEDVEVTLPFLTAGSVHPLEVYFSNELVSSFMSIDVWDPTFTKLGKDEMPFLHPVNSTVIRMEEGSSENPLVRSIDWTGRTSAGSGAEAHIDAIPPLIVPGWDADWFNTTTPDLGATVTVPEDGNGSGIDISSIAYSFEMEGLSKDRWETGDLRSEVTDQGAMGPLKANISVRPYLEDGWRGTVRFTAADLAGNRGLSDHVWLGIDTEPPGIALLSPGGGKALYGTSQNVTVSIFDGSGSGPDGASIEVRSNPGGAGWTDWRSISPEATERPDVFKGAVELIVGTHELQFRGRDIAGNPSLSVGYMIDIMEPPVNRPPVPNIAHPPNGTRFLLGQVIELSATGTWDDGLGPYGTPLLTWFSSRDGYLGQGSLIKVTLTYGLHNITLFADDGAPGHNISRTVSIEVLEWDVPVTDDDPPADEELFDPLAIFALGALLIVVVVLMVFVIIERRGAPKDIGAGTGPDAGPPSDGLEE